MNRDRLHLWQDRLARNDSQYENWYALMDERERLYQGSRYIFPLVNKYRPSNAKTPHVRNICSELIEAQVDSNIPSPKVTAVHEKDEPLAKIIEDMLRNEMDRLPFAEINDLMERIVPIQGGGAYARLLRIPRPDIRYIRRRPAGASLGSDRLHAAHQQAKRRAALGRRVQGQHSQQNTMA